MNTKKTKGSSAAARLGKAILIILAIAAIGGGAYWYFLMRPAQAAKSAAKTAVIRNTATVERGDISLTASGSGTLVASQAVNMSFSTSGKVAELNVKLGDMVKAGDVLARLDKADDLEASLASAQADLLQAQQALATLQNGGGSALAKAYQDMVTAQATYDQALTTSQRVTTARCSPDVLAQYQRELDGATSKLSELMKKDPNSNDTTIARYDYNTAVANYAYCTSYTSTEKDSADSNLAVAKAALQQAQDTYNTLKAASGIDPNTLSMDETKVETAQTRVTAAQEMLDGITLKAPIDGKITSLAASVGTIVDTSTFLTISDVSHPTVTVSLDETNLDTLVVGNTATVTFTAMPGKTFTGKVSVANPQMSSFGPFSAATGQVELDQSAVKALENMPLGMSATIVITGQQVKNALLVPLEAVESLRSGDYAVTVMGSDGKLTQQIVQVGLKDGSSVEITSGLKVGQVVSYTTSSSANTSSNQGGGFFFGGEGPQPQGR